MDQMFEKPTRKFPYVESMIRSAGSFSSSRCTTVIPRFWAMTLDSPPVCTNDGLRQVTFTVLKKSSDIPSPNLSSCGYGSRCVGRPSHLAIGVIVWQAHHTGLE